MKHEFHKMFMKSIEKMSFSLEKKRKKKTPIGEGRGELTRKIPITLLNVIYKKSATTLPLLSVPFLYIFWAKNDNCFYYG